MKSSLESQAPILADKLAQFPEVEAVVLAGSLAAGTQDSGSDIDLYVYASPTPPVDRRLAFAQDVASSWEVDNRYWETEDLLVLKSGMKAEIIWRDFSFIQDQMERTLDRCEAWVGYTTCFWANLLRSRPLFDRTGRYTALQKSSDRAYPAALIQNIIKKNLPLLADSLSSYAKQTAQAESRQDKVTINHRVAAYLASWFDILFAVNRLPHPGEKKQVKILQNQGSIFPKNWEKDVVDLLSTNSTRSASQVMGEMDLSLRVCIEKIG